MQRPSGLGGGSVATDGTVASSRSISGSSTYSSTGSRVISSSGLLGGGGFLGNKQGPGAGSQAQVTGDSMLDSDNTHSGAGLGSGAEQFGGAHVIPETVPKHTRPRRRKVGPAGGAAAVN